jgi:hypothetical protein
VTVLPVVAAALLLSAAAPDRPGAATHAAEARPRRQGRAAPLASPLPEPPPARPDRAPGTGAVAYVTAARAFLDVGADDGLAEAAELELRRAGAAVGTCRVETLAPHHATCTGAPAARAGDRFEFTPATSAAAAATGPAPKLLPPLPSDEELARRQAAVEAAPVALVDFKPGASGGATLAVPRARVIDVAWTHASFVATDASGAHRESLDVDLHDVDVGGGVTLDVDARALRWLQRASPRFRPKDDTQLYVWQAQIGLHPGALTLSAGRVLPWTIPGATIFDGALVGKHTRLGDFDAEVGAFGGLVPDPVTTAPGTDRATGGGYWLLDRSLGRGATFRQEGRVAVVRSPELGTRFEGSLTARLFLRTLDLSGEAHLGFGGTKTAPGGLDAGRLDVNARPAPGWTFGGSFRYSGLEWPQPFEPPAFPGKSRAGDAFARWDARPWLRLGLVAGDSEDTVSSLAHRWVGPEVTFPTLLGSRGAVTVAYLEETGWTGGRSAYAQVVARPWDPIRVIFRASWSQDKQLAQDEHEVGAYAALAAELTRHLGLRLSVLGRGGVSVSEGGSGGMPWGMTGYATLYATY